MIIILVFGLMRAASLSMLSCHPSSGFVFHRSTSAPKLVGTLRGLDEHKPRTTKEHPRIKLLIGGIPWIVSAIPECREQSFLDLEAKWSPLRRPETIGTYCTIT